MKINITPIVFQIAQLSFVALCFNTSFAQNYQEQPMEVQEQPMEVQEQPMEVQEQPMEVQEQPMEVQEQPTEVQEQPTEVQEQPMAVQEQPMEVQDVGTIELQEQPEIGFIQVDPILVEHQSSMTVSVSHEVLMALTDWAAKKEVTNKQMAPQAALLKEYMVHGLPNDAEEIQQIFKRALLDRNEGLVAYLALSDIEIPNSSLNVLNYLAQYDFSEALYLILKNDVKRKFDINARDYSTPFEFTPLHSAARYGSNASVAMLIEFEPEVDLQLSITLETPLHLAALFGSNDMVKALLEAGANPRIKDHRGALPLHYAVLTDGEINQAKTRLLISYGSKEDYIVADANGWMPYKPFIDAAKKESNSWGAYIKGSIQTVGKALKEKKSTFSSWLSREDDNSKDASQYDYWPKEMISKDLI